MSPAIYHQKIRKKLLACICGIIFALHALGIYLLKDLQIQNNIPPTPIKTHLGQDSFETLAKKIKKKNQDLENIFTRLTSKDVYPQDIEFDYHELNSPFIEAPGKSLQKIGSLQDSVQEIPNDIEKATSKLHMPKSLEGIETLEDKSLTSSTSHSDVAPKFDDYYDTPSALKNVFSPKSLLDWVYPEDDLVSLQDHPGSIFLNEPTLSSSENTFNLEDSPNFTRTLASSSDFMVQLEYAPKLGEDGFIFKLSLAPKPHKHFQRIKQNYFFLIDRSHSVSLKNFVKAKEAVAQALDYLQPEDTFNIYFFDEKIKKLSKQNISAKEQNIEQAKKFLKTQKHGGFFASTDLYASLEKIVPSTVEESEVNTAILLSDGDTYLNKQKQRKIINHWSQKNNGKVSLFTLAIGNKNNLPLLDLLSVFNKGTLRVANTKNDISNELTLLMQAIRAPIGKNINVSALCNQPEAEIQLFPSKERLPNLYENLEYVIYGTLSQASDFNIFVQGRYYDCWLDIKKTISLSKGTLTEDQSLKKGLLLQKAYGEYEQFLSTGHPKFLDRAKKLLEPANLPIAFE